MDPIIIGLTGPAGSGKTTLAGILSRNHGFMELSFADPIRSFLSRITGFNQQELDPIKESPLSELCGRTPRQFMQWCGTEFGRNLIGPDIWIRALDREMEHLWPYVKRFVISDVRFQNEADWIRAHGALWHLTRPGTTNVAPHSSENGIDFAPEHGDRWIDNYLGMNKLESIVAAAVEEIGIE